MGGSNGPQVGIQAILIGFFSMGKMDFGTNSNPMTHICQIKARMAIKSSCLTDPTGVISITLLAVFKDFFYISATVHQKPTAYCLSE
jgi:hypothetical protein